MAIMGSGSIVDAKAAPSFDGFVTVLNRSSIFEVLAIINDRSEADGIATANLASRILRPVRQPRRSKDYTSLSSKPAPGDIRLSFQEFSKCVGSSSCTSSTIITPLRRGGTIELLNHLHDMLLL